MNFFEFFLEKEQFYENKRQKPTIIKFEIIKLFKICIKMRPET